MKRRYIITGANGHLGNTIIRMLQQEDAEIYGLILPGEQVQSHGGAHYITGDIRDMESLRPLFADGEDRELYVIHTAGIIDISEKGSPLLYDVNINGTKNMVSLCKEYGVRRMVYVSSVHAIPEGDSYGVITEADRFEANAVTGAYARTKASATQLVLDAGKEGLDVVVVHPSGIIGPYDRPGHRPEGSPGDNP